MPQIAWDVVVKGSVRRVSLKHGWLSGLKVIQVDGLEVFREKTFKDVGGTFSVQIDGVNFYARIESTFRWPFFTYALFDETNSKRPPTQG